MKIFIIILATSLVSAIAGHSAEHQNTTKTGSVSLSGGESLALRAAMNNFDKHVKGTRQQKDLSHYKFKITSDNGNFYVNFDPCPTVISGNPDWVTPDGFYLTMVVDRKTFRCLKTLVES